MDATTFCDKAFITVITRDYRGYIIKVWAKQADHFDPTMAELAATNWALELVVEENFENRE